MKSIMIVCMVGLLFVATSVNAAIITSYARDGIDVGAEINGAFLHVDDVDPNDTAPIIGGVATTVTAVTIASNEERTITYRVTGTVAGLDLDFSYDVIVTAWQSVSGVESMVNIRENGGEVMPDSSLSGEHKQRIDSPDTVGEGNWEFVRLTIDNLVINSGTLVSLQGFNMVRLDGTHLGADGNVENADTDAVIASWIGGVADADGKYRSDIDLTSAYASSIDLVATGNSGSEGNRENSENQPRGFAADFAVGPVPASPAIGATVLIGGVDLSWTNMDPNNPGDPVFVDVWFGTEPNELNSNYDMALVITDPADGRNVAGVAVNAPVDGTYYYWQVANYIYGDREGDPIEGPLASFIAVSDAVPTVQIDTHNTMTWSDEPVLLDWDWTDDGSPALSWGAEPDGIEDPNLNVEFFDVGPNQTEVAITNTTGSMVTVAVTLTVDDGNNDPVAASIELDVYPTACDMTRLGQGISDISDVNDDCVINLDDFEILIASKWLDDYSATEPAARQ